MGESKTADGRCYVCGGPAVAMGTRDGYEYLCCRACRHVAVRTMPTAELLSAMHARYSYDVAHLHTLPPIVARRMAEIADSLAAYRRTGRLLDVGFGAGMALKVFAEHGWEAHGIESSQLAVEQAQANGLPFAVHGDFLAAPFERGSFDVVLMFELIEHLPDPRSFVRHALTLLRPGGLLYLTTPNGAGLSGRMLGVRWSVACPPDHMHLFSPSSARRVMRDAGFRAVTVRTYGTNPQELIHDVRRRWTRPPGPGAADGPPREGFDRVASSYALNARLHRSRLGRGVRGLANVVLDLSRLGDSLKVFARRTS